jgi:hypothetical protein
MNALAVQQIHATATSARHTLDLLAFRLISFTAKPVAVRENGNV